MTTYDPKKVLPKDDWALLCADERSSTSLGGLILPGETGVEKVTEFAGRLIRLGGGKFNDGLREHAGLKEGNRVLYRGYLKFANPLPTDEKWESGVAKEYFFVNSKDIMGIVEEDVAVGVFGGSRAAPHVNAPLIQGPALPAGFKV